MGRPLTVDETKISDLQMARQQELAVLQKHYETQVAAIKEYFLNIKNSVDPRVLTMTIGQLRESGGNIQFNESNQLMIRTPEFLLKAEDEVATDEKTGPLSSTFTCSTNLTEATSRLSLDTPIKQRKPKGSRGYIKAGGRKISSIPSAKKRIASIAGRPSRLLKKQRLSKNAAMADASPVAGDGEHCVAEVTMASNNSGSGYETEGSAKVESKALSLFKKKDSKRIRRPKIGEKFFSYSEKGTPLLLDEVWVRKTVSATGEQRGSKSSDESSEYISASLMEQ